MSLKIETTIGTQKHLQDFLSFKIYSSRLGGEEERLERRQFRVHASRKYRLSISPV